MSDTTTAITFSDSEWYMRPSEDGSCFEVRRGDTDEVIAVADYPGDATLISCSKNLLFALAQIQHIISIESPDGSPILKTKLGPEETEAIMCLIVSAFEKLANEAILE